MSFRNLLIVIGIGWVVTALATFAVLTVAFPSKPATPHVFREYNLILYPSGNKVGLQGDRIEAKDGCSQVWKNGVVDTVVCLPHIITEREDSPQPAQPSQPSSGVGPTQLGPNDNLSARE